MFAIDYGYQPKTCYQLDQAVLRNALSELSDEDLESLEDDLDFCNFAGVPSGRVLEILEKVVELDEGWRRLLQKSPRRLSVPQAY
jgi:hypothetical protein